MSAPDRTLYDELGAPADASEATLRNHYRRRARQLHPDVAGGADNTGDDMRRLNEAWAVLRDPVQRRRYDLSQAGARSGPTAPDPVTATHPGATPARPRPRPGHRIPYLRPSALILLILAAIFVVTAYAGPGPGSPGPGSGSGSGSGSGGPTSPAPPRSRVPSPPGTSLQAIGQCLYGSGGLASIAIVPCSARNDGQILAEVATVAECPTGTLAWPSPRRPTILCTASSGSSGGQSRP